ncbi:unnamed protein product [Rhizophagus irregularis]|uniref:Uncharacterized protein n=1 Tax=Rhizophagus irregularis TaxID=588596 RepID=A0A916DZM6_9GLOM|nr:unnamed protein product [Rhizophagus irregularis]CAB5148714.1 unnamed protein product [Rhizophagus irregularis]CAB5331434.1 unnamed protein product [Rhizophagus irregularis]
MPPTRVQKPNADDMEEEPEVELYEPLLCTSLFGGLFTEYATNSPAYFGGRKRSEMIRKMLFPDKFSQDTFFSHKKLNKNQAQQFNTALQATAI